MIYIFTLFLNKGIKYHDAKKIVFSIEYLKNNLFINKDSKIILYIYYLENTATLNFRKYIFDNLNKEWVIKEIKLKSSNLQLSIEKFLNQKGDSKEKLKIINEAFIELSCMGRSAKIFSNEKIELKNKPICLINVSNITKFKATYISQSIPNFEQFPDDYIYLDRNIFGNVGISHDWIITGDINLFKFCEISKFILSEDLENIDVNVLIKRGILSKLTTKIQQLRFHNIPLVNILLHKIGVLHINCKIHFKRTTIIKRTIRKIILCFLNKIDISQNLPPLIDLKDNSKSIKLTSLENKFKSEVLLKLFFQKKNLWDKIRFVSKLDFYDQ